ncbi:hypothetical protein MGLY_31470 [Neomoorella glycerini]|uniref:Uncharacterized protein n=1 Tax=Neomoorella glycerini TaxID=55779 RepID=A0A6I5ZVJ0_9FIRM|nr:hypothetical protein [Moorella glycerini]QGP93725.1 hypothetical protein MGLY_31470 [Moorella glycerini]
MPSEDRRPSWRDYYQILTTIAMVILGPSIWLRSLGHPSPMAWVTGAGFLGIGLYRLLAIARYFYHRRKEVRA